MNPDLLRLHPYPFEKIKNLLHGLTAADVPNIALSVGEPKHAAPEFVLEAITESWRDVEKYPPTRGSAELRQSIANWLQGRYQLGTQGIDPENQILPVNGTREALFAIAQCLLDRTSERKIVLSPNPFYQIYEGAIFLAGLTPTFYNLNDGTQSRPNYWPSDDPAWAQVQMVYICNPGNPTGSVMSMNALQELIKLAARHNFTIVSDECYSEVYRDEAKKPEGLLSAAASIGNDRFEHCLVFHSLSKRSNLPGLRSGFVAGDASLIKSFLLYRTYHGCSMAPPTQAASTVAWSDEEHVIANRALYNEKYAAVIPILEQVMSVTTPEAGFYLWPQLGIDDEKFTQDIHRLHNISVVPGSYLSREIDGTNPGTGRVRLALVAPLNKCVEAAEKIRYYFEHQPN